MHLGEARLSRVRSVTRGHKASFRGRWRNVLPSSLAYGKANVEASFAHMPLFGAEAEGYSGCDGERVAGRSVNACDYRGYGSYPRLEVILRFVIAAAR